MLKLIRGNLFVAINVSFYRGYISRVAIFIAKLIHISSSSMAQLAYSHWSSTTYPRASPHLSYPGTRPISSEINLCVKFLFANFTESHRHDSIRSLSYLGCFFSWTKHKVHGPSWNVDKTTGRTNKCDSQVPMYVE